MNFTRQRLFIACFIVSRVALIAHTQICFVQAIVFHMLFAATLFDDGAGFQHIKALVRLIQFCASSSSACTMAMVTMQKYALRSLNEMYPRAVPKTMLKRIDNIELIANGRP